MGETQFKNIAYKNEHKDADDAFSALVRKARYEHGNSGYTGTIAEKASFYHECTVGNQEEAEVKADSILDVEKYDPAAMIEFDLGWIFFGRAAS